MVKKSFVGKCLLLSLCAAPLGAQTVSWDQGPDAASLSGQARADAAKIPAPPAAAAAPQAPRGAGLVIDATEIGVGKFHRRDNQIHAYPGGAWIDHISPGGDLSKTPIAFDDADGATTIQFSNLEELLRAIVSVSRRKDRKVSVLNIHGHGIPGAMWYPKDEAQKESAECSSWNDAASAKDDVNYGQYYSMPTLDEVMEFRRLSESSGGGFQCTTGAPEWKEIVPRVAGIKGVFADDAQVHFQSCLVGLGSAGDEFTKTVAALLLQGDKAGVQASMQFGLGDWSMPEGMGFWDYVDDAQLARDGGLYSADRKDREVMQKGSIRVASGSRGQWTTRVVSGQSFMTAGNSPLGAAGVPSSLVRSPTVSRRPASANAPSRSPRIPGTGVLLIPR